MKLALQAVLAGAVAVAGVVSIASAQDGHVMLTPEEISWGPAPPSIPAGAEAVVLYGNPGEDGLFALRLKFPAGYSVPAHYHPKPEVLTVISGTFNVGMGKDADRGMAKAMPAGSIITFPADTPHFVFIDEETVVQLNSVGPFGITYVNPDEDPRPKSQ
jgi:quercetin dioxygenase-like cupin family protein